MVRFLKHLFFGRWQIRRRFSKSDLSAITDQIAATEKRHRGEIVFAVESSLSVHELVSGKTTREKAVETFAKLKVWDTEENNGVLIYLLLADRNIEILADRGVYKKAGAEIFERICRQIEAAYVQGDFLQGTIAGIDEIAKVLIQIYPLGQQVDYNELPDQPVIL